MTAPDELRRLLEMAARAQGYQDAEWSEFGQCMELPSKPHGRLDWRPHEDDGDSRRLEVALELTVIQHPIYENPKHSAIARRSSWDSEAYEWRLDVLAMAPYSDHNGDKAAATRMAVLRAAAAIGEAME